MFKNAASQSVALFAFDTTTGLPKTGDAANMLFYITKDWGSVTAVAANSGVPTEMDATNAKGWYKIAVSQTESNADAILFSGKSSTSNISVVGVLLQTVPAGFTALTTAAIATGVWQDTTAGDFTTALSVGKSVMNGVSLGTGLTVNDITTKTGYSLTQTFPTNFSALGISAGGHISNVDTLTTYTGNTVQTGDSFARLGAPAGASHAADVAAVKSDTGTTLTNSSAIKTQTDKLAFTVTNQVDANALSINGNATAASNVAHTNQALTRGTVGAASSTTSIICSAVASPASVGASGQFIGRTILFDADTATTNLQGQATNITGNTTGATPTFTVTALTTAPVSGDKFSIV